MFSGPLDDLGPRPIVLGRPHRPEALEFDGALPDLNLGTAGGASCRPELQQRLAAVLEAQDDYTHVVNGRFKGGYITRHYGSPETGVDAVQLEIAQHAYMDEDSFEYLPERAAKLQAVLRSLLEAVL